MKIWRRAGYQTKRSHIFKQIKSFSIHWRNKEFKPRCVQFISATNSFLLLCIHTAMEGLVVIVINKSIFKVQTCLLQGLNLNSFLCTFKDETACSAQTKNKQPVEKSLPQQVSRKVSISSKVKYSQTSQPDQTITVAWPNVYLAYSTMDIYIFSRVVSWFIKLICAKKIK